MAFMSMVAILGHFEDFMKSIKQVIGEHQACSMHCDFCKQLELSKVVPVCESWKSLLQSSTRSSCLFGRHFQRATHGSMFLLNAFCPSCQEELLDMRKSYSRMEVSRIEDCVNVDALGFSFARQFCIRHNVPKIDISCFGDPPLLTLVHSKRKQEQDQGKSLPLGFVEGENMDPNSNGLLHSPSDTFWKSFLYVPNPCYLDSWNGGNAKVIWSTMENQEYFALIQIGEAPPVRRPWNLEAVFESKPYWSETGQYKLVVSLTIDRQMLDVKVYPPQVADPPEEPKLENIPGPNTGDKVPGVPMGGSSHAGPSNLNSQPPEIVDSGHNIWHGLCRNRDNDPIPASTVNEILVRIGSSFTLNQSITTMRAPVVRDFDDKSRNVHKVENVPESVEGQSTIQPLSLEIFWDIWSTRMEFDQNNRYGNHNWAHDKVQVPNPHSIDYRHAHETSYYSFNEYKQFWSMLSVYVIYCELSDLSGKWENWNGASVYKPPYRYEEEDFSSANVSNFTDLQAKEAHFLYLSRTCLRGESALSWRQYDVVMVDVWYNNANGKQVRAFTSFGVVTECTATAIPPDEEREKFDSTVLILGLNTYANVRRPDSFSEFTAIVRNIGFVGSSVRGFTSIQELPGCPQEVQDFLCGSRCCIEDEEHSIEKLLGESEEDLVIGLSRTLWNIQEYTVDYLYRFFAAKDGFQDAQKKYGKLNKSQICAITRLISRLPTLHETSLLHRTLVIVGPAGTGKTSTLGHTIGAIFNTDPYRKVVLEGELVRRRLIGARSEGKPFLPESLSMANKVIGKRGCVLIICPTNAACDVIEEKILNGTQIRERDGTWRDVVLPYTRLTPDVEKDSDALDNPESGKNLDVEYKEKFPEQKRGTLGNPIVITTFGSLYRMFPEKKPKLPVRIIFIDEASCVSDMDMAILYAELSKAQGTDNILICLLGDPMQRSPIAKGRKTWYTKIFELSFLERMVCPMSPAKIHGESQVVFTLLNVQYRMNPTISRLSNVLADRTVYNGDNTRTFAILQTSGAELESSILYRPAYESGFFDVRLHDLAFPIVFFDPYWYENGGAREFVDASESYEISSIEVDAVKSIIRALMESSQYSHKMVTICSTYSAQVRELSYWILKWLGNEFPDDRTSQNIRFSTVAGVQGQETDILIYSAVKGYRRHEDRSGNGFKDLPIGLVRDLRPLYVTVSRAKAHLYIVGELDYLSRNADSWDTLRSFVDRNYDSGRNHRRRRQSPRFRRR